MSRVGRRPITLPKGVELTVDDRKVLVKGPKGTADLVLHPSVNLVQDGESYVIQTNPEVPNHHAMSGTMRSLVANMVLGTSQGFERKLQLVGVGYRAQAQGKVLNLALGFSHPIEFAVPDGIQIDTPSQTEIVIKGTDKQQVGQVAAKIRGLRPPEPYKGKGVRYADETVALKEAKKK